MKRSIVYFVLACLFFDSQLGISQNLIQEEFYNILQGESVVSKVPKDIDSTILRKTPSHYAEFNYNSFGDSIVFTYVPEVGFYGYDEFQVVYFEYNEGRTELIKKTKKVQIKVSRFRLNVDAFTVYSDQNHVLLDVLANDEVDSDVRLKFLPIQPNSQLVLSNDSLSLEYNGSLKPIVESLLYSACDANGHCETGSLKLIVLDTTNQNTTISQKFLLKNATLTFDYPYDDLAILNPTSHGLTSLDGYQLTYTPNQDFVGWDTLTLVSNLGKIHNIHFKILDANPPNVLVKDDYFFTLTNKRVICEVLKNDFTSDLAVTVIDQPEHGNLVSLTNGNFYYLPQNGYQGVDAFIYSACETQTNVCETGVAYISIGNFAPDYSSRLSTGKNHPLSISYPFPVDGYNVSILNVPQHGLAYPPSSDKSVLYVPSNEFVGSDSLRLQYCLVSAPYTCYTVNVIINVLDVYTACTSKCVWPGDNNNDGIVNMRDLLFLGPNIGNAGTARSNTINDVWVGQACEDWGKVINKVDLKYADANGDGGLTYQDLMLLDQNYKNVHGIRVQTAINSELLPFVLHSDRPSYEPGDSIEITVNLGDDAWPINNLLGFATSFSFSSAFDGESLYANIIRGSWINADKSSLDLVKKVSTRLIDVGSSRIAAKGVAGQGPVAVIKTTIVESMDGFKDEDGVIYGQIDINESVVTDDEGNEFFFAPQTFYVPIIVKQTVNNQAQLVRAFPNPTQDQITIEPLNKNNTIHQVVVYDILGNKVLNFDRINDKKLYINLGRLPAGLYLAKTFTSLGSEVVKVTVN